MNKRERKKSVKQVLIVTYLKKTFPKYSFKFEVFFRKRIMTVSNKNHGIFFYCPRLVLKEIVGTAMEVITCLEIGK